MSYLSSFSKKQFEACKTLRNLERVHARIIRNGCEQDQILITNFISLCTALTSNLSYTTSVFERLVEPNVYIWNTIINGYCKHSSLGNSILLLRRMMRISNVTPDHCTFPSLIKACAKDFASREGRILHGLVVKYGSNGDVHVGSSLVYFYGKCKEIECALKVFDEMRVVAADNVVSWTAMLAGYWDVGNVFEAHKLFDEMPERNSVSWNTMISGFVKIGELERARKLFNEMPENWKTVESYTTMINGYAKAGYMSSARMLFEKTDKKDVFSWSALISGYSQNGQPKEALKIFDEMQNSNVKPDEHIMVSLMSACSQLGCLESAKWIDSYMSQSNFDLHQEHIASALIDMNAKCGNLERAGILFEQIPKRNLFSYCSMIHGLSIHGCGEQAVVLFDRMLKEGVVPDKVAFTVILAACSRAGLLEKGCQFFNILTREYSLDPSPDQYACLVDLLGRSGRLKDAYEILKSMSIEHHHAGAWGALLKACKLHSDVELGEEIAERLLQLDPLHGGNYVSLSNLYAAADRWLDVSRLRFKMSERGIKKQPGCSWI